MIQSLSLKFDGRRKSTIGALDRQSLEQIGPDLAAGAGDLKRVLTNVKTRGSWGEVQLGALLAQMLAPD